MIAGAPGDIEAAGLHEAELLDRVIVARENHFRHRPLKGEQRARGQRLQLGDALQPLRDIGEVAVLGRRVDDEMKRALGTAGAPP